ncbi:AAA family ATPase [Clostridium perfringens]|nr:AAA family ATPase [Clostridium perfringens]MDK0878798.1 AAA family ATPase [Clostridium perfringens]MDK0887445.1 AAA family ATPase [Clostridium perfringens]
MHIAIEGMDGAGKTSVAKLLAEKIGFKFVEKPLHYMLDEDGTLDNYMRVSKDVNKQSEMAIKTLFYGLGNVFVKSKFKGENIVTDRHLVSNYFWNCDEITQDIFDVILKHASIPKITFLLYANEEVRLKRIIERNPLDDDVNKINLYPHAYEKMKECLEKNKMDYVLIDNSEKTCEEVVSLIIDYLKVVNII